MRNAFSFLFLILVSAGCSAADYPDLIFFDSPDAALNYGLKKEGVTKKDVVGILKEKQETYVFYQKKNENGLLVNFATISGKKHQYTWYRPDADVMVQHFEKKEKRPQISWQAKTFSGKKLTVYTGLADTLDMTIYTPGGPVTPEINEKLGIYYYIEPR